MSRRPSNIEWRFVDYIPEHMDQGVIYIALNFGAMMHLCLDGCGERISTPLSPGQWALTFDGETISLWPSVGNWDLPCGSHYIIRRSRVLWSGQWNSESIKRGAQADRIAVERLFERREAGSLARPTKRWGLDWPLGPNRKNRKRKSTNGFD